VTTPGAQLGPYAGYDEADLLRAVHTVAGRDLGPFFLSLVNTNRAIDCNALLQGLGASVTVAQGQGQKTFAIQYLTTFRTNNGHFGR
jgi:hypothetical protein